MHEFIIYPYDFSFWKQKKLKLHEGFYFKVFIHVFYVCLLKAKSENYMLYLSLKLVRLQVVYGSHRMGS